MEVQTGQRFKIKSFQPCEDRRLSRAPLVRLRHEMPGLGTFEQIPYLDFPGQEEIDISDIYRAVLDIHSIAICVLGCRLRPLSVMVSDRMFCADSIALVYRSEI